MHSVGNYVFSYSDLLGHGAFAIVYKGIRKGFVDDPVAIKKIRKDSFSPLMSKERKEISILSGLKHENIVRMLDFEETTSDIYLVLEFCNMGDLNDFLHKYNKISEEYIRIIFKQIGLAIAFLHSHQIIHRDLKPQNILLHSNYSCLDLSIVPNFPFSIIESCHFFAKIGDFGFARVLADSTMATTLCGSPLYMAPEVLLGYNYDSKVDMWSIGTIIYQCFTGSAPFIAKTPQLLRKRYETEHKLQPKLPIQASPDLNSLLLGLLKKDFQVRLGHDDFCTHPFFQVIQYFTNIEPIIQNTYPCCNDNTRSILSPHDPISNDFSFPQNNNLYDNNYMFAAPGTRVHCLSHNSIDPLSNFSINHSSHKFKPSLEISPTRSGYVFVPTRNTNILLKSENRLISSLPTTSDPPEKSFISQSSIAEVPFSSLVPLNAEIIEKDHDCRPKIRIIHDFDTIGNISPRYALDEVYDMNIVKNISSPISNNSSQHTHLILPSDRSSNCQNIVDLPITSCSISTMFIDSFNIEVDNHSRLPINIPPLQYLECPFQPLGTSLPSSGDINPSIRASLITVESEIFSPAIIENEDLKAKSRLRYSHKGNELISSEIQQYIPQEKTLSSLISPQCNHSDSDPHVEIHRTILHSQYILNTICFLKYPSFSQSIANIDFFSQKSYIRFTLKKLVLLVKVVRVISKILDCFNSLETHYPGMENSEISKNYRNILKYLEFAKNELSKIKFSYSCTPNKFDVYRSFIPSAETLLCNQMIYVCQNGTLKQIFDKKEHVYRPSFFMAWLLSKELSALCYKETLPSLNIFSEYTHDIVFNRSYVL
ncbi:Serine/threonine-protein kinase ULK1-like [Oopsacas minuta]|uniref:Serine/threonine-protein kinase ULK1-like n=1 Tax=Oopsacas minuta TaxID=111878 RepID=A0AAV7JFB5_9METZ|nr:Serine/threonine-protein kinase ULK1-like [Oopsacas minuta]